MEAGVPQGSILGSLLFLIYINDIVRELNWSVRLFKDDTSLFIVVENPVTAANILSNNLGRIHSWACDWLADFNPSKIETMIISRRRNKLLHPYLMMDNTVLNEVETLKHLGLMFSQDCSWHAHIEEIVKKAWHRITVLKIKWQSFNYLV